jgi:hypothetical protein
MDETSILKYGADNNNKNSITSAIVQSEKNICTYIHPEYNQYLKK